MDQELKQYLDAKFDALDKKFATKSELEAMQHRLIEKMRDMQTELARGFASFSQVQTLRLRKVEADQSNLDAALSGRVNVLEGRLLEIEIRLGLSGK